MIPTVSARRSQLPQRQKSYSAPIHKPTSSSVKRIVDVLGVGRREEIDGPVLEVEGFKVVETGDGGE